jgi:hypothetical protein
MPKQPLALRLHTDPAYVELVRMVGYRGILYPIGREDNERLIAKYGKEKLAEASDELIDYDTSEKIARLKPGVRRLCRGLLGPSPEEWEQFYEGVEHPPPNPYTAGPAPADEPAATGERELLATMHGRKLRELLLKEHKHFKEHRPGDPAHAEAIRRIALIEPIMKARGQKVPPRPTVPTPGLEKREERIRNLEGSELMQRYFTSQRVLESESERTGVYRQTKIEYDLLKAECKRRGFNLPPSQLDDSSAQFARATTHRLRELLDTNRYDMEKNPPSSISFKEALRDIGFIEAELRRRRENDTLEVPESEVRGR